MRSNDLRSGNFIQHKKDYWRINDIFGASGLLTVYPKNGESLGRRSIHDFEPILLTEDWLLKFGLKSHNLENGYYDGTCIGHYPKSEGCFFVVDSYDDGYGGLNYTTKEIKYVHELQNLYFFWYDKELELK